MTQRELIQVRISGDAGRTAYVRLPGHSAAPGAVAKTVLLADLIGEFKGPTVHLDFDKLGELIGIEILVSASEARTPRGAEELG